VAPGFIETAMTSGLPPEVREQILARVPLGRMGTAEEVADAVLWLATGAHYVQGAVIPVNGGMFGG
jgi:3-oxoacyl-[acyl-carrier protein] reductase